NHPRHGLHRVRVPRDRRRGSHEHHARLGDRAHARDRRAQGGRRVPPGHRAPVPDGGDDAVAHRRRHRDRRGDGNPRVRQEGLRRPPGRDAALVGRRRPRGFDLRRHLLRPLSGGESLAPRSDRGASVRVSYPAVTGKEGRMSRTWKIVIAAAAVLAVLVIAGQVSARDRKIPRVTTAKAAMDEMVSKVTANGKIQAEKKVDLSALVMGQIVNLAVRDGDRVKKGDFLLQIDRNRAEADAAGSAAALEGSLSARDSARATRAQAQRDHERAKRNYDAKILPEADYQRARSAEETAEADLRVAERRIEQSRANLNAMRDTLSKTTVRSPINGIVTDLPVKEGEVTVIGTMNIQGTQLLTISDMSSVEAVLMVGETDVPNVKVGQKGLVAIDADPAPALHG